jgi:hypothetical protein
MSDERHDIPIHDDDCGERLVKAQGTEKLFCKRCNFAPDMQSIAFVTQAWLDEKAKSGEGRPEGQPLEEQLVARLREWFKRSAPLTQANWKEPSITFVLRHPQGDDDGTLVLEAVVEEKSLDDLEGRVPGERLV